MDELDVLYGVVSEQGLYTKSLEEFKSKYSNPANQDKLYEVVSGEGLYTKTQEEFKSKYFTPVKKKETTESPSSVAPEPSALDGSETEPDLNSLVQKKAPRKGPFPYVEGQEEGTTSSHLMAQQDNVAFPTIFQNKDGSWTKQYTDFTEARKEAEKRGEVFEFETEQKAIDFAEGAWKKEDPSEVTVPINTISDLPDQEYDPEIEQLYHDFQMKSFPTIEQVKDIDEELAAQERGEYGIWDTFKAAIDGFISTGMGVPMFQPDTKEGLLEKRIAKNQKDYLSTLTEGQVEALKMYKGKKIESLQSENTNVLFESKMLDARGKKLVNDLKYHETGIKALQEQKKPIPDTVVSTYTELFDELKSISGRLNQNMDIIEANDSDLGTFENELALFKKNYGGLDYYKEMVRLTTASLMGGAMKYSAAMANMPQIPGAAPQPFSLLNVSDENANDFLEEVGKQQQELRDPFTVDDIENASDFIGWSLEQIATQIPIVTTLAMSGGTVGLGALGIAAAGGEIAELQQKREEAQTYIIEGQKALSENPDLTKTQRLDISKKIEKAKNSAEWSDPEILLAGTGVGALEILTERVTLGILSKGARTLKSMKGSGLKEVLKRGKILAKELPTSARKEGFSEFANSVGGNAIDIFYLGDEDVHIADGAIDALSSGSFMGFGMTLMPGVVGMAAPAFQTKELTKEISEDSKMVAEILGVLEDQKETIDNPTKLLLQRRARKMTKDIQKKLENTYEAVANLSKEDIRSLIDIQKRANKAMKHLMSIKKLEVDQGLRKEIILELKAEVDLLSRQKAEILGKEKPKKSKNATKKLIEDDIEEVTPEEALRQITEEAGTEGGVLTDAEKHRAGIKKKFAEVFTKKGLPASQIMGALAIMDARAKSAFSRGEVKSEAEWFDKISDIREGDFVKGTRRRYQLADGRTVDATEVSRSKGFYSPMYKAVFNSKQEKMPVKQWVDKFIRGEEAEWTGVKEWIESQEGPVHKQDILQFLADNQVVISEIVKDDQTNTPNPLTEEEMDLMAQLEFKYYTEDEPITQEEKEQYERMDALYSVWENEDNIRTTKHSAHILEGDVASYQEILITRPNQARQVTNKDGKSYGNIKEYNAIAKMFNIGSLTKQEFDELAKPYIEELKKNPTIEFSEDDVKNRFVGYANINPDMEFRYPQHFDEADILAHVRATIRRDNYGRASFFIEEIQSDWGQTARRDGINNYDKNLPDGFEARLRDDGMWTIWSISDSRREPIGARHTKQEAILAFNKANTKPGVPDAPFIKDTGAWAKLAIKSAVKAAVEAGAKTVSWTTGEQQNQRYSLSNAVDRLEITPLAGAMGYDLRGYLGGEPVVLKRQLNDTELAAHIGKELAQKAIENANKTPKGHEVLEREESNGDLTLLSDTRGRGLEVVGTIKPMTERQGDGFIVEIEKTGERLAVQERSYGVAVVKSSVAERSSKPIVFKGDELEVGGKPMKSFYGSTKENNLGLIGNTFKKLYKLPIQTLTIQQKEDFFVKESQSGRFTVFGREEVNSNRFVVYDTYDNVLQAKAEASKLADMFSPEGAGELNHSIEITQELIDQVLGEGQPLFQKDKKGTPKGAMEILEDGRVIIHAMESPDFSTMIHEIAHVFERDLSDEELKIIKKNGGSEGFARGFEKYLRDGKAPSEELKDLFKQFREWLVKIYRVIKGSPIERKMSPDVKKIYNKLLTQNPNSLINTTPSPVQQLAPGRRQVIFPLGGNRTIRMTVPESIDGIMERAILALQDKLRPVRRLQKKVEEVKGAVGKKADFDKAETALQGKASNDLNIFKKKVEKFAKDLAKSSVSAEQFSQYLYAKFAPQRNAHILENVDETNEAGSGMTNDEADEIMNSFTNEQLTDLRRLEKFTKETMEETRKLMLKYGLKDAESIEVLRNYYDDYVPLKGFADENEESAEFMSVGPSLSIKGKEIMGSTGRKSRAGDPLSHILSFHSNTIIRGRKNEVMQTLYHFVKDNPEIAKIYSNKNPDTRPTLVKGKRKLQRVEMAKNDLYVGVKVKGVQYYIKFHNAQLAHLVNAANQEKTKLITQYIGVVNRMLSALLTTYDPEFIISNFFRDTQTAMYHQLAEADTANNTLRGKNFIAETLRDIPISGAEIFRAEMGRESKNEEVAKYYKEFKEDGAKTGWFYAKDSAGMQRDIQNMIKMQEGGAIQNSKKYFNSVKNIIENSNTAVENAVRLSAYMNARKAGVERSEAGQYAKELTVNFNRSGTLGPTANAVYLFFNASVQGTARFAKAMTTLKKSVQPDGSVKYGFNRAQKLAGAIAAYSSLATLANMWMSGEDEDGKSFYSKIPDWEKERNMIFMDPFDERGENYFKVPLPYGYNVFNNAGMILAEVGSGDREIGDAIGFMISSMFGSFAPISFSQSKGLLPATVKAVVPTAFRPIVELAINEDFFGSTIYNENLPFGTMTPHAYMGRPTTPETFKVISQFLNEATGGSEQVSGGFDVQPEKFYHFYKFAFGGTGKFIDRSVITASTFIDFAKGEEVDWQIGKIPFMRRLYGETSPYTDLSTYFDRRVEIRQRKAELDAQTGENKKLPKYKGVLKLDVQLKASDKILKFLRGEEERVKNIEDPVKRSVELEKVKKRKDQVIDRFNKEYNKYND